MARITDTRSFIEKAAVIHNGKFGYDNLVYTKSSEKVIITCISHGDFQQTAADHLRGTGCPACSNNKKLDNTTFILNAQSIHGDRYDYSQVNYISSKKHVDIICHMHGAFKQAAGEHFSGKGCPECGGTKKKTTEKFIEDAKKIHGNLYDYGETDYVSAVSKIRIKCSIHGIFEQTPNNHLSGYGCAECAGCSPKTQQKFLLQCQEIHKDLYEYPQEYVSAKEKIVIVCKKHGEFQQRPADHINSEQGCPKCGLENRAGKKRT